MPFLLPEAPCCFAAVWYRHDLLHVLWVCFVVTSLPCPTIRLKLSPFAGLLSKPLLGTDVGLANPELFRGAADFAGDFVPVTFYRFLWDWWAITSMGFNF